MKKTHWGKIFPKHPDKGLHPKHINNLQLTNKKGNLIF